MSEYYGCRYCGYLTSITIHNGRKIVELTCSDCGLPLFPVSPEVFEYYFSIIENPEEVCTIKLRDRNEKEIGTGSVIFTQY
jgi:transcription elongation factor Elf1